jgi:hypothetical protein
VATAPTAYWADLAEDLQDPEFRRTYVAESRRIEAAAEGVQEQLP